MKTLVTILFAFFIGLSTVKAQKTYTCTEDAGEPGSFIYNGIVSKADLQNNAAFTWYAANANNYTPKETQVSVLKEAKGKLKYLVFGGTWCSDTHFILPKFFKLTEAAGIADQDISFFATDRNKKTIGNITEVLNITNVPTIIVMKAGKEVGRLIEYGSTGMWDQELADLVKKEL